MVDDNIFPSVVSVFFREETRQTWTDAAENNRLGYLHRMHGARVNTALLSRSRSSSEW